MKKEAGPMKKLLKFLLVGGGVLLALFLLLLVVAAVAIPILLPPAKMKAMVTDKLSEALKHKVSVSSVSFNVLSGFDIQGLNVANRTGWADQPLLAAKDISISYHLLPLLWGQVSLGEIVVNEPDILVERKGLNSFNFSDMAGGTAEAAPAPTPQAAPAKKSKSKAKKKRAKSHAELPPVRPIQTAANSWFVGQAWADTTMPASAPAKSSLNLSVSGINIVHGKMVYLDETLKPSQRYDLKDLNCEVKNFSMTGGKFSFSLSTPLESNNLSYQFSMKGTGAYFASSQTLKGLDLAGTVNDLGFKLSGDAATMNDNFTPHMDGEASLDMLKFSGLVPRNLSSMPPGLSLTGPAKVDFHLGGSMKNGLELSGTADGSDLAIAYQDLFVKTAKTTCKVNFKSVIGQNSYDLPSFSVLYQDWEVDGSFHHPPGAPWTCTVKSKALPLKGISDMVPKFKKVAFDGDMSINVSFAESKGKATPFTYNGQVAIKNVSITLPNEPYLQNLNSVIYLAGNSVRMPSATFQSFDGSGIAGVTVNLGSLPTYGYAFSLKNVNGQKAIDASIDAYVTKNPADFKDKIDGTMNLAYAGSGKGFSGDAMMASQVGSGNYSIVNSKIMNLSIIKLINQFFKDNSQDMKFDEITGNLGMKNKVFSFTANTTGNVGTIRVTDGINVVEMAYSPNMLIQCDIKKEFINSDKITSNLPGTIRDQVKNVDALADGNGNVPIDIKATGPVKDNNFSYDWTRLLNNVTKKLKDAAKALIQNKVQDLGGQLKSLFH